VGDESNCSVICTLFKIAFLGKWDVRHYNLRKFSFYSRVVNICNSLPDSVVDANTLNTLKSRLHKHWLDQDVLDNFHSVLTGTGGASICL